MVTTVDTNAPLLIVVDDDFDIRQLLVDYLIGQGFQALPAANSEELRRLLQQKNPDLIILDLNLPGEDGLTICRNLRAQSNLPVLMLTARAEAIDRILGLEMGADDYLTKPFEPRELVARVRNILRRAQGNIDDLDLPNIRNYRFAGMVFDVLARHLVQADESVTVLANNEFKMLKLFLERPQRVLSRDWLGERLMGRSLDPADRSIDLLVSRVRQRIGDDARKPTMLKTVRSEGYLLAVTVEKNVPLPPQSALTA